MGQLLSTIAQCISSLTGSQQGGVKVTDVDVEAAQTDADPEPVYIAVIGPTGSGKTTFVNQASGSVLGVGQGLESCTSEVQTSNRFSVGDKQVILMDTPGFGDTTLTDSDIWKIIAASFVTRYREGIRFAGVIYMQRISDVKVSGSIRQSFRMFQELCGEEAYPNVILVTGMWDTVPKDVGDARYRELETKDIFFKPVLEKGARMMRHDNTLVSALEIVRNLVDKPPVTLRIQQELGGGLDIMQTSVYRQIHEVMSDLISQRRRKLDTLMEEMAEAERDGDEQTREELEEEVQAAKVELQEAQDKVSRLSSEYEAELRRLAEMPRASRNQG